MKLKLLSILVIAGLLQAETLQFTEYVSVSSSMPEYQTVQESVPYQECYDERVPVASMPNQNDNVGGAVLGGIVGGVIGHQIGEGKGNDMATVGGAILGTIVGGNSIEQNRQYSQPQYRVERKCTTRYRQSRAHRQFVGYENIAYYKGKKIVKYSNEKLRSIPVTVTIDY